MTACPLLELKNHEVSCPIPNSRDYVNAFVVNQGGEALVMEHSQQGRAWGSWQTIGRYLDQREDPLTAVQQTLLDHTGYAAKEWIYLGSFAADKVNHQGAGHFFLARQPNLIAAPLADCTSCGTARWVPISQIKQALLDGRISVLNHAIAATLALVLSA